MLQTIFLGIALLLGDAINAMDRSFLLVEIALDLPRCVTIYEPNAHDENYQELSNISLGSLKLRMDGQTIASDVDYASKEYPGLSSLTLTMGQGGQCFMSVQVKTDNDDENKAKLNYRARLAVLQGQEDWVVGDEDLDVMVEDRDMAIIDRAYCTMALQAMQRIKDETLKQHFPSQGFTVTGYRYEREGASVLRRKDGIINLEAPKLKLTYRFMIQ